MLVAVRASEEDPDLVIPIGEINPWMPSVVGLNDDDSFVFGEAAEQLEQLHPDRAVRSIKTHLGANERTVTIDGENAVGQVLPVDRLVQGLLEETLQRARERATPDIRRFLEPPFSVHLGCPANWTAGPRKRLGAIAEQAGLKVLPDEIVDEPIAAGISWVMGSEGAGMALPRGRTLVFDYGGGTLDVAVLEVGRTEGAKDPHISVLSASAVSLAGDKFDERLAADLKPSLQSGRWSGDQDEVEKDQLILRAAREIKHSLSSRAECEVRIPGFQMLISYTREQLEAVFQPQLRRAMQFVLSEIRSSVVRQRGANIPAIRAAPEEKLAREIDHVLLAGGMSRIPCVREELNRRLMTEVVSDQHLVAPEVSVVAGLTFRDVVGGLNIHRPGFDFIAKYLDAMGQVLKEQVLYEGCSPLYKPYEPSTLIADLGHRKELAVPAGADRVRIVCRTLSNHEVALVSEGLPMDGIEVEVSDRLVGPNRPFFKLYVDGRIILRGKTTLRFDVERWPFLKAGLAAELHVQPAEPEGTWYGDGPDPGDYHYNR